MLLCLDYGDAKVGVAMGSMLPSSPIAVIRYSNREDLLRQIQRIIEAERPEGLVIGWPADQLAHTTPQTETIRLFGESLGTLTGLPVIYYPETLTTQAAQRKMIEAGISKMRRRAVEDSFAAAAILDSYFMNV